MKITEIIDNDNNVSRFSNLLGTGSFVPTIWYHKLLRPCGKSDCTAISILSELVSLYHYNSNTEFQLNFKYFKDKFNFGLSQVKDAVIRLEKLGLVTRSPRTLIILGRTFANEMFLVLNIDKVLKLSEGNDAGNNKETNVKKFQQTIRNIAKPPTEISSTNEGKLENINPITRNNHTPLTEISSGSGDKIAKLQSNTGNNTALSVEISSDSAGKIEKSQLVVGNACISSAGISSGSDDKITRFQAFSGNPGTPYAEISSHHIYLDIDLYKNNNKTRYISRSNRSSESDFLKIVNEEKKEADSSVTNPLQILEKSSLDKETAEPTEQSNPETSLEKANDCCRKEVIGNEVEVGAEVKDLSNNQSVDTSSSDSLPNYVTTIWSKFNFFGKKLSEFYPLSKEDRDLLAVKSGRDFDLNFINQLLLKINGKYPDHKFYNKNSVLNYVTKLLKYELRDAVKVSNGYFRFKSSNSNDNYTQIVNQERYLQEIESSNCSNRTSNNLPISTDVVTSETDSIWSRVRCSLIQHFQEGEWLDKAWFSKLEAIYDHDHQKLTLKAPTNFIRDRVWQQYGYIIAKYCAGENCQLVGVQS